MYLINMKKLLVLFALLCIVSFSVNSCKPDDDYVAKDWPIPQEVLDYYFFKKSTFWVFENDKTGEKDTLRVENTNKYWIDGSRGDRFEQGDVFIKSSLDGYTYHYYVNTQGSAGCIRDGKNNRPCYSIYCTKYKPGNFVGESSFLFYPFQKDYGGQADGSLQTSIIRMVDKKDSMEIETLSLKDVLIVNISNSIVSNRKNMTFYWAKGKGLIQKDNLTDNQTWKLIDHMITM